LRTTEQTDLSDTLAGEEPLELRIGGLSFAVTMRTPGADFDLAAGFLVSEGIITSHRRTFDHALLRRERRTANEYNILDLTLGG